MAAPAEPDLSRVAILLFGEARSHAGGYPDLLSHLRGLDQECALLAFSGADVVAYRSDPAAAGKVEIELGPDASTRVRRLQARQPEVLGHAEFVVKLDGEVLYGGVCHPREGAAALRLPVLHVDDAAGNVRLDIGAVQGAWAGGSTGAEDERRRIDPKALQALFQASGRAEALLVPAAPPPAPPAASEPPPVALPTSPSIVLMYGGPDFSQDSPLDLAVALVGSRGTALQVQLANRDIEVVRWCGACSGPHLPAPPPHRQVRVRTGPVRVFEGEGLQHLVRGQCKTGGACTRAVPVPPGEYTVVATGQLRCAEVKVRLPLKATVQISCGG